MKYMKNKGYQLTHMGLATLSSTFFFLRRNSYLKFSASRIYAKSRVGSEGMTGLKTRGRPPRLDDKGIFASFVLIIYNQTPII